MSAAQALSIQARRWELVDDMSTSEADLAAFYKSPAWVDYLAWKAAQ